MAIFFLYAVTCSPLDGGYTKYSSSIKQLDFTFEYPQTWRVMKTEQYKDIIDVDISAPVSENESSVDAIFTVCLNLDLPADQWAQNNSQKDILTYQNSRRNFQLVSQNLTSLNGFKGYQIEYTYDGPTSAHLSKWWIPIRVIQIYIPRNDRVYDINIGASENEWNAHKDDILHILDTFKWKR